MQEYREKRLEEAEERRSSRTSQGADEQTALRTGGVRSSTRSSNRSSIIRPTFSEGEAPESPRSMGRALADVARIISQPRRPRGGLLTKGAGASDQSAGSRSDAGSEDRLSF